MIVDKKKEPYENCTQFDTCDVNKCPLHPDFETLENFEGDSTKCKASKTIRMSIAKAFNVKSLGLTKKEYASRARSMEMRELYKSVRVK